MTRIPREPVAQTVLALVEEMAGRKSTTTRVVSMSPGHLEPEVGLTRLLRPLHEPGPDLVTSWTPLTKATESVDGDDTYRRVIRQYDWVMGMRFSTPTTFEVVVGGTRVWRRSAGRGDFEWMLCGRTPLPLVALTNAEVRIRVDKPATVELLVGWARDDIRRSASRDVWVGRWITAGQDVDGSRPDSRLFIADGLCYLERSDRDLYAASVYHDGVKFLPDAKSYQYTSLGSF